MAANFQVCLSFILEFVTHRKCFWQKKLYLSFLYVEFEYKKTWKKTVWTILFTLSFPFFCDIIPNKNVWLCFKRRQLIRCFLFNMHSLYHCGQKTVQKQQLHFLWAMIFTGVVSLLRIQLRCRKKSYWQKYYKLADEWNWHFISFKMICLDIFRHESFYINLEMSTPLFSS